MYRSILGTGLGLAVVLPLATAWISIPLRAHSGEFGPIVEVSRLAVEGDEDLSEVLRQPIPMPFENETPLADVLRYVKKHTESEKFPKGLPIYVDPEGLMDAERTMQSPIKLNLKDTPLEKSLEQVLDQLGLGYWTKDGMLLISSKRFIP